MFYMPVPDPNQVINGNYKSKSSLGSTVLSILVHEEQHLINAGRRIYVNDADAFEEVWLNEGLSHIAEELLYYEESGNSPRGNIGLSRVQSSQAQVDAINTYQLQNLGRSLTYLEATETNSPYAQNDNLETRGAIWQLLRYAADRTSANEQATWFNLVNSTTAGQANFNNVLGDIVSLTRDMTVSNFVDDMGLVIDVKYSNVSWNFRSILPAINNGVYPLTTHALSGAPVSIVLNGGGAAYVRFQVNAGATGAITATSSGQPLPAGVDVLVVRTK
jgi:hypothetical protein